MQGQVRVGVVGLGSFGAHHARHYSAHKNVVLTAFADADFAQALAAVERYGGEAHASHRSLIGKVDAASVTVPASLHHSVAADLIDAGIHVFVEKPLATNAIDASDLLSRAKKAKVTLQVGHIERFSSAVRALTERVREPRLIECVRNAPWNERNSDTDVVLDLMIHDIDLALMIAKAPVEKVEASGTSVKTGFNDTAETSITFRNGVVATLAASRISGKAARTLSVGEAGRVLIADLAAPTLSIVSEEGGATHTDSVPLTATDALGAEISAFIDSVSTGKPPVVDGQAGLDAVRVADMILAAIARSRIASSPARAQAPRNGVCSR